MAVLFAVFTAIASFGIGSTVQSNAISTILHASFGISAEWSGAVLTLIVAIVILGGVKSIARVCSAIVPFMAFLYIFGCLYILCVNFHYVLPAIRLILVSAFSPEAMGGGLAGGSVLVAARYGIARGLFSNESGLGSAPIVAAAARTRNPVRQALVSATGTFWDTIVLCAITGVVIVSSILAYPDIDYTNGAELTKMAFGKIPVIGPAILSFGLLSFAFSTILGWSYYGERVVEYMKGGRWIKVYRMAFILSVFIGSVSNLTMVWNVSDCMNALMAIPNLLSLIFLSGVIVDETRKYLWSGQLECDMRTVDTQENRND